MHSRAAPIVLLFFVTGHAAGDWAPPTLSTPLSICTTPDDGFDELKDPTMVVADVTKDQELRGFNVDGRQHVLTSVLGVPYTMRVYSSYGRLQVAVRSGECDIGWAAFFITGDRDQCSCRPLSELTHEHYDVSEWRCCVDYLVPFHRYGEAIMHRQVSVSFINSLFRAVSSVFVVNMMCFIFMMAIIFAHLVWLAERKANAQMFPAGYVEGLNDAIWWALVTVTTVGYGDRTTITTLGRLVAVTWMLFGIVLFSILSGSMATEFAAIEAEHAFNVDTVADLVKNRLRVCTYDWMFNDGEMLESIDVQYRVAGATMAECGEKMRSELADATVMDAPIAMNWRAKNAWARDMVISKELDPLHFVSLMVPEGGGRHAAWLNHVLSPAMAEWGRSPHYAQRLRRWFPPEQDLASAGKGSHSLHYDWHILVPTTGFIGLYILLLVGSSRIVRKRTMALQVEVAKVIEASEQVAEQVVDAALGAALSPVPNPLPSLMSGPQVAPVHSRTAAVGDDPDASDHAMISARAIPSRDM